MTVPGFDVGKRGGSGALDDLDACDLAPRTSYSRELSLKATEACSSVSGTAAASSVTEYELTFAEA